MKAHSRTISRLEFVICTESQSCLEKEEMEIGSLEVYVSFRTARAQCGVSNALHGYRAKITPPKETTPSESSVRASVRRSIYRSGRYHREILPFDNCWLARTTHSSGRTLGRADNVGIFFRDTRHKSIAICQRSPACLIPNQRCLRTICCILDLKTPAGGWHSGGMTADVSSDSGSVATTARTDG